MHHISRAALRTTFRLEFCRHAEITHLPSFLVPSIDSGRADPKYRLSCSFHTSRPRARQPAGQRRGSQDLDSCQGTSKTATSSTREGPSRFDSLGNDPNAWLDVLDPLIPKKSRTTGEQKVLDSVTRLRIARRILAILEAARLRHDLYLLADLGLIRGRWRDVVGIVQILLDTSFSRHGDGIERCLREPASISGYQSSLDDITGQKSSAILPDRPRLIGSSLDDLTDTRNETYPNHISRHNILKYIWPNLSSMVLAAAQKAQDQSTILYYVRQILGHLHHADAIPDTVYSYDNDNLFPTSTIQRPPTLYLLSSRILTSISDAVWRADEEVAKEEAAAAGAGRFYQGYEVPAARYRLKVRELGPEVWMELILWCCVESQYVEEATTILNKIAAGDGENMWSVIDWKAVQNRAQASGSGPTVDWDGAKSRYGGVVGGIEGYSMDRPFVEMGARTISAEIILAVIDGLFATIRLGVGDRGNPIPRILRYLKHLNSFLSRNNVRLSGSAWDRFLVRIVESGGLDGMRAPAALENVLKLATNRQNISLLPGSVEGTTSSYLHSDYVSEQSTLVPELLQQVLRAHLIHGNLQGSIRAITKLQALIDSGNSRSITPYSDEANRSNADEPIETTVVPKTPSQDISESLPQIPILFLGRLMDLLTREQQYDIGRWLLYAENDEKPMIHEKDYGDPNLAPSLLRFSLATSDDALFSRVSKRLETPFTPQILYALFQCQVELGRWEAAQSILDHFKTPESPAWDASVAMSLAKAVLLWGRDGSPGSGREGVGDSSQQIPHGLLRRLLSGEFGLPSIDRRGRRSLRWRRAHLSYVCRVLRSVSADVAALCPELPSNWSRRVERGRFAAIAAELMSTDAFNILLDGHVAANGSFEGMRLYEIWCSKPTRRLEKDTDAGVPKLSMYARRNWNPDTLPFEEASGREEEGPEGNPYDPSQQISRFTREYHGLRWDKLIRANLESLHIIARKAIEEAATLPQLPESSRISAGIDESTTKSLVRPGTSSTSIHETQVDKTLSWATSVIRTSQIHDSQMKKDLKKMARQRAERQALSHSWDAALPAHRQLGLQG